MVSHTFLVVRIRRCAVLLAGAACMGMAALAPASPSGAAPVHNAASAVAGASAAATAPVRWQDVNAAEFDKLIRAGGHILLDVRTPREFRRMRIAGAINIDVNSDDFDRRIGELDRGRPVLVYCRIGQRSAEACDRLLAKGFARVFHLDGGIVAWEDAGKAVETDEP